MSLSGEPVAVFLSPVSSVEISQYCRLYSPSTSFPFFPSAGLPTCRVIPQLLNPLKPNTA